MLNSLNVNHVFSFPPTSHYMFWTVLCPLNCMPSLVLTNRGMFVTSKTFGLMKLRVAF